MSKIVHTLPTPPAPAPAHASMTLGAKVRERAVELPTELLEEMCEHLLAEKKRWLASIGQDYRHLPPVYLNDAGFRRMAVDTNDFLTLLAPWINALGKLMLQHPRGNGEAIADYCKRLVQSEGDGRWSHQFEYMSVWLAHIARIEDEERAQREREAAQRKREEHELAERKLAERKALERQATVDASEVKRLLAVIEEAREVEELLALHERAQRARRCLLEMYAKEREACVALGQPVPERSIPGWPLAFDPPTIIKAHSAMNGEGRGADTASPPSLLRS